METPEGKPGNQQPDKAQRMQSMLDLSSKFGGVTNIPEEELSSIGYIRKVMEDGTVRAMPQEYMQKLAKRDTQWEQSIRTKERPFERIAITLTTADRAFRFVPPSQRKILLNKLRSVEYAFYPNWNYDGTSILEPIDKTDPRLQNLRAFSYDFLRFLEHRELKDQKGEFSVLEDDIAEVKGFLFNPLPIRKDPEKIDPSDPNDFLHDEFLKSHTESDDGSITSADSKKMYDELTRLSGYYGDVPELTRDFQVRLAELVVPVEKYFPKLAEYFKPLGIQTHADFIRYMFPKYLQSIGLPEMAAVIGKSTTLYTVSDTLKYMDTSDSSLEEEKELRRSLKSATTEERNLLGKRVKDVEEAKKRKKQIRQGVIDYFSSPVLYAEVCKKRVKEAQDFLLAGKGTQTDHALFYLDATDNKALDKDPGVISGDCTEGKPLPFNRPDIPAYNVKIFTGKGEHVGNMYLLVAKETQASGEKKKVWHFDAIQVPMFGIGWEDSINTIVGTLANAAKAKGIDAITVNDQNLLISNYDYIQEAVRKYWETNSGKETRIDIPQINEKGYSNFQGTGKSLVLWRSSAKPDIDA